MLASCVKPTLYETRISEDVFGEAWREWRDFLDSQDDHRGRRPAPPIPDKSGVPGQN
jgi:hypothetical protein